MDKIKRYITKEKKRFSAKLAHSPSSCSIVERSGFSTHLDAQNWLDNEYYKIVPNPESTSFAAFHHLLTKEPDNGNYWEAFDEKVLSLTSLVGINLIMIDEVDENLVYGRACSVVGSKKHVLLKRAGDGMLDTLLKNEEKKYDDLARSQAETEMSDFLYQEYPAEEKSLLLLDTIQKMPGSKILTLNFTMNNQMMKNSFYIHDNGHVGDLEKEPSLRTALLSNFDYMLNSDGGPVVIRQFIPDSAETEVINGREVSIPWKALYAVYLNDGKILPLSAEDVEHSMNMDAKTGKALDPENKVVYKDFNEFLNQSPATVPKFFS